MKIRGAMTRFYENHDSVKKKRCLFKIKKINKKEEMDDYRLFTKSLKLKLMFLWDSNVKTNNKIEKMFITVIPL